MTKLFLDTNIILDLLATRIPFYTAIAKLATLADQKKIILAISPLSCTTVEYVLKKFESQTVVLAKLRKLKIICTICDINEQIIEKALNSGFADFEDAVQYFTALEANCSAIITRNGKDFKMAKCAILTAEEFLIALDQ